MDNTLQHFKTTTKCFDVMHLYLLKIQMNYGVNINTSKPNLWLNNKREEVSRRNVNERRISNKSLWYTFLCQALAENTLNYFPDTFVI